MLVLAVVALLSGAAAGRTITAYGLLPLSAVAAAAAAIASDMTPLGVLWRAGLLVGALQIGFVAGAASVRLTGALGPRAATKHGADAVFLRTGRRFFRGRLRGSAKGGY